MKKNQSNRNRILLIVLIMFAFLIRFVWIDTLIERDEGIFGYYGWRILEGDILYKDIFDSKTPLIYYSYAVISKFFGNSIYPIRIINNLLFILSLYPFFFLAKKYTNQDVAGISSFFYVFYMNLPIFEGQIALTESFVVYNMIWGLFFLEKYLINDNIRSYILSSIFFALGFFYNQTAIVLFIIPIISLYKKKYYEIILFFLPLIIISMFLLSTYILNGAFIGAIPFLKEVIVWQNALPLAERISIDHLVLIFFEGSIVWIMCVYFFILFHRITFKNKKIITLWFLSSFVASFSPTFFGMYFGHHYLITMGSASVISGIVVSFLVKNKKFIHLMILLIFLIVSVQGMLRHWPDFNVNYNGLELRYNDFESVAEQKEFIRFIESHVDKRYPLKQIGWSDEAWWINKINIKEANSGGLKPEKTLKYLANKGCKYLVVFNLYYQEVHKSYYIDVEKYDKKIFEEIDIVLNSTKYIEFKKDIRLYYDPVCV